MKRSHLDTHSWFDTIVDGNELGPVYPFQLKQLKYELRQGVPGQLGDSPVSCKSNSDYFPFLKPKLDHHSLRQV